MLKKIVDYFLYEHFLYECILRQHYDIARLYPVLKDIFFIEEDEALKLASSDVVKEVTTEEEYKRFLRIYQYNKLLENDATYTDEEHKAIIIKGEAILVSTASSLIAQPNTPALMVERNLLHHAKLGNTTAMRMIGLLKCEGIFFKKNKEQGLDFLEKASSWGDVVATLTLLKYDEKERMKHLVRLHSILTESTHEILFELACDKYQMTTKEDEKEIHLLRKIFASDKADSKTYNAMISRILYSPIIRFTDKEKILFAENKETISTACDLPLKLSSLEVSLKEDIFKDLPIKRKEEQTKLTKELRNIDLRTLANYRPICLTSDSEIALNLYQRELKNMWSNAHIELIEVKDLLEGDFEPTKNHIFLRNIDEDKPNIYLFRFRGDIADHIVEKIISFLQAEKRKDFYISIPAVFLDLRSILPICISDKENKERLKTYTEEIEISAITKEEKPEVIIDRVEEIKKSYKLPQITLDSVALEQLCSYSLEFSEKALDMAIKDYRIPDKPQRLTLEMLEPYLKDKGSNQKKTYGFGGYINENNK